MGTIGSHGVFFYLGGILWHNYGAGGTFKTGCPGQGSAMVAGGMGDYAFLQTGLVHGKYCIAGAAGFEGANFLQVFCFEVKLAAQHAIEQLTL